MLLVNLFWWLLFLPTLISLGLLLYALGRRNVVGAAPFALTMAGWFLWAFGYLLELGAPTLERKIFWDNLQFLGIDLAVAGVLLFALVYSGQVFRLRPVALRLSLFPLLNLMMVWSNAWHGLVRSNAELRMLGSQVSLIYDYGPWFWASLAYNYLLICTALIILVRFAMRNRLHRPAVLAFVVGFSAPTLGGLITAVGLVPIMSAERLDISPLTFIISGPLIAWGLFRKGGLLNLVPIARSLLIDQMLDGTLVIDQSGRIVDANPQAHVLLRRAPMTLPGQNRADLAPLIAELTTDTERRHGELRLEGEAMTVLEVTATPIQGASARRFGWLVVLRDITERTAWIDELRSQEELFRLTFDQSPLGAAIVGLDHQLLRVNRVLCEITGYSQAELLGYDTISITHPDDRAADLQPVAALLSGEINQYTLVKRYLRKDGALVWARVSGQLVHTRAGQPRHFVHLVEDITAQILVEADLERQSQYHRTLATCSQMLLREIRADAGRDDVLAQALAVIRRTINAPRLDLCESTRAPDGSVTIFPIAENVLPGLPACPFSCTMLFQLPPAINVAMAQGQSYSGATAELFAVNPAGAQALADAQAASILLLPVEVEGSWWGVLAVSDAQPDRTWDAATVDFLHTVATMIASFIQHAAAIATLHEREHFIQQINQTTPDTIYVYDLVQQQLVYLNQAGQTNFSHLAEPARSDSLRLMSSIIHPDDQQRFTIHHEHLRAAADRAVLTIEYRTWDAQGRLRWMFGRDTVFSRDEQGQPIMILGIAQEITARKEAELALLSSELRLRALLTALPDLMFLLSPEGIFLDYQAPHSEALLTAPKRLLGSQLEEVLSAELAARVRSAMQDLSASGKMQIFDYLLRQHDQEQIYEARLVSAEVEGVLMVVRDVTETRRSTEALRRAKERAEAADQAKSMFVAQMSHEIRTPLNTVIGMAELLMETPLSDEQREYAAMIGTGGRSLLAIVNDILDLARIESGRIELDLQPFSLAECLEESLDLVRHSATGKHLELHYRLAPDLPELLLGDAARLRQILVNLLSNAIKFTERGEVTLAAACRRDATTDGLYAVRLVVSDTGIGITPEQITQIFAPFVQADGSISRRYGGTGLGLTISRKLAALMQGELAVESVPGVGSTFTLSLQLQALALPARGLLPAVAGGSAAIVDGTAEPAYAYQGAFLIVEDNPINQEVLRRMLLHMGHTCDIVASGTAALEAIRSKSYSIVFMDVQMPELDGVAATRLIRAMGRRVDQPVIIAVTASALPGDREHYLSSGMNAYLSKPIRLESLSQVLEQFRPGADAAGARRASAPGGH